VIAALALASLVTLTDVDDGRACTPLAKGGFVAATGGGLLFADESGKTSTMTALDGLPETRVHAVAEQGDALWVGTEAGAALVTIADRKVVRTVGTAPVHAVHVSASGAIWLGTRGQGVLRLDGRDASALPVPGVATGKRAAAFAERDGIVFAAYADGPVARLEGGALRPIPGSPTHGQALAAVGGDVVLGDLEGLYRLDARGAVPIASVDARAIAPSGGSSLLVATYGGGLLSGTIRGALRPEAAIPANARGVAVRGSARCVATTSGLYVDAGKGSFTRVATRSLPSNDVTAIAPHGARMAIGTFDGGAAVVENGLAARIEGIDRTETINALAWQGDTLWLATARGLVRRSADGTIRRFTSHDGLPSTTTRALAVLAKGRVLVGTEAGPAIVDGDRITPLAATKKGTPAPLASPMHATWAVAARADGTLFIGTASGLYWGKDGTFARASLATGELEDDWVTALALDGDRDVFVGTYAKGVTRLRFTGGKPTATHLGGGYVNPDGLVIEAGKLYAATMDRLLVRAKDDDGARWAALVQASPGRDVTGVRFAGGRMWTASRRGIGVGP
jgi:ligand-binding sensor domain-containing protein